MRFYAVRTVAECAVETNTIIAYAPITAPKPMNTTLFCVMPDAIKYDAPPANPTIFPVRKAVRKPWLMFVLMVAQLKRVVLFVDFGVVFADI